MESNETKEVSWPGLPTAVEWALHLQAFTNMKLEVAEMEKKLVDFLTFKNNIYLLLFFILGASGGNFGLLLFKLYH